MRGDHDLIEELLAARALDGLDDPDRQFLRNELARHGDCDLCRRLEREYEETAGRLAFALDPKPVAAGAADAILRRAAGAEVFRLAPARSRHAWQALVAVAAVVVLVATLAVTLPRASTGIRASTDLKVVHFSGAGGELAMAYSPAGSGALFLGSGFSDPGPGKAYEIWMIQGKTPVRGGRCRVWCAHERFSGCEAFFTDEPAEAVASVDLAARRGTRGVRSCTTTVARGEGQGVGCANPSGGLRVPRELGCAIGSVLRTRAGGGWLLGRVAAVPVVAAFDLPAAADAGAGARGGALPDADRVGEKRVAALGIAVIHSVFR